MLEQQHSKFEYKDLSKNSHFVESSSGATHVQGAFKKDEIIGQVVSEHFIDNFTDDALGSMTDIKTHKIAEDKLPETELGEIKTQCFSEDGQNMGDLITSIQDSPSAKAQPEIDVEKIKEEAYQKGYKEAESLLSGKLEAKVQNENLNNLLQEKLSSIEPSSDLSNETFEVASGLIAILAKKLHLAVPADFEAIILGEMVPVLNKYHKKGKVIVRVNPERVDYCNNLFRIGELPETLLGDIELVPDEAMLANDCSIDWQDATLEYNQEDLIEEADNILEHLKMKIEN